MKSIKQRILLPFISIIILLPVVILILFNVIMNIYISNSTKQTLSTTLKTMQSLIRESELSGDNTQYRSIIRDLSSALTASKLSGDISFYILDNETEIKILYPRDLNNDDYNNAVLTKNIIESVNQDGIIERVYLNRHTYYMAAINLHEYKNSYNLTVLFVTNSIDDEDMMLHINIALSIIIIIAILIGILSAIRIATSITKPIMAASEYAYQIGEGNFITVPIDKSSREFYQLDISMNQMSRKLKQYDETQKKFLQNASHELRTPLMSIQGYAEGLENDILTDYRHAASIIRKECERLSELVAELLTLSRIQNETLELHIEECNAYEALEDIRERLNGLCMKENRTLNIECPQNLSIAIDQNLFRQIVINLASNGLRYAKTMVQITCTMIDSKAVIYVIDDGEGFSQEDLPHIFERFYKGKKGKFGLGLAIAQSGAYYMKGSLKAYNHETLGAVFELQLPVAFHQETRH